MADYVREVSFSSKNHNRETLQDLYSLKKAGIFCDVIMRVAGSVIHVHSVVLAASSPYFRAFLTQDLPRHFSHRSPQIIEIQIEGEDSNVKYDEAVNLVIDYLYTGVLKVSTDNVVQISELARIMELDKIHDVCGHFVTNLEVKGHIEIDDSESDDMGHLLGQRGFTIDSCVSTSTQVTPMLLGFESQTKKTRDIVTQTSAKDFPEKRKSILVSKVMDPEVKGHIEIDGSCDNIGQLRMLGQESLKTNNVILASAQVTPLLIGCDTPTKITKDSMTQTLAIDFREKGKSLLVSKTVMTQTQVKYFHEKGRSILVSKMPNPEVKGHIEIDAFDNIGQLRMLGQRGFKTSKLVSASTQVTPMLLGLEPPIKVSKDCKTQTLAKDFPEKGKHSQVSKVARGRPSSHDSKSNEITFALSRDGKTNETSVTVLKNQDNILTQESSEKEEAEIIDNPEECKIILGDSELTRPIIAYTENEAVFISGLSRFSTRKSGRRSKPTPKIIELKKHSSSTPKGSSDKNNSINETSEESIFSKSKETLEKESPRKSSRKTQVLRKEVKESVSSVDHDMSINNDKANESDATKELHADSQPSHSEADLSKAEQDSPRIAKRILKTANTRKRKKLSKFRCTECDFRSDKVREFAIHKRLHKLDHNICYYCELKFEEKENLTNHLQMHKGPLPYFCPICDSRFKSRTQLNVHLPKHSDKKPFVCTICQAGFKWKHALKSHMVVHSNRKDHLCDECGYATAHKCQLKAHKLLHTGQTYRCTIPNCKFQATKKQNLKYHMLTHTQEKPHQCEICGRSFSLIKNLRRHMLLHYSEKQHQCEKCDFSTTRFDKLKEHMLKTHGMGSPPEKRIRVADLVQKNSESTLEEALGVTEASSLTGAGVSSIHNVDANVNTEGVFQAAETGEGIMQFLPGQTIIIASGQDGGPQAHQIIKPEPAWFIEAGTREEINGVQLAEVMVPVTHLGDLAQEFTFVSQ